ncbi:hypothetical protein B1M_09442 [Burkholderia sp. TJI49]|nr:hypothetical protein B1M_09442 [Burkholderia sp. TJI49]
MHAAVAVSGAPRCGARDAAARASFGRTGASRLRARGPAGAGGH